MNREPENITPHPLPDTDARVRRVEILISNLLRIGVVGSLVVILAGTVISFARHPDYTHSRPQLQRLTRPGAGFPQTMGQVIDGVKELRGQSIVVVGLLLLVATPVMRVAVSIFAFVYQHDLPFVIITSLVLLFLLLSFVLGRAGG